MTHRGVFGGERRLVLESVGTADAVALRAIRQLVPGAIQEVARLVYQAPSELTNGLHDTAAAEVADLLGGLGFRVSVAPSDAAFRAGVGEFEIALVVTDMDRLPPAIAEAAAFLGTDLATARRLVCRAPAVLVSNISEATVSAVRDRFGRFGVDVDVSRLSAARYYAVVAVDNPALRRTVTELIRDIASDAAVVETEAALTVADLSLENAQALWGRLQRTGARASICNRDLERYDVSLNQAPDTAPMREMLVNIGLPVRVVPRVLGKLPVIIQQNVGHTAMQALLDRVADLGGRATGLPHSFQRFALVLRSVKDAPGAIKALVTLGDLPELAASAAVKEAKGVLVGNFTRTTALWLQHTLAVQGTDAGIELL